MSAAEIRNTIRARRRALSPRQQQLASDALAKLISQQPFFLRARRVAFYLASDGEIDPSLLLGIAQASGKNCYLPVLHPLKFNRLYFAEYTSPSQLRNNRFGIPEPKLARSNVAPAWSLDCIFMPLVAFDRFGSRMGMGGGFYDRTLAFTGSGGNEPRLIGLAHHCQEVGKIERNYWDIPLTNIATDREIICAKRK